MSRFHLGLGLLALVLATGAPSLADDKPASKDLKALFEKAEAIEVYSLDPSDDKKEVDPSKGFHGWKILGKTTVKDAKVRKKLIEAVYKGLAESDGTAAKCFMPRHGLRATSDGKTADVVICFECLQMEFFAGDKKTTETTTRSPEKVLDEVLTTAGVPLAPKK
jgi:hypothetical protein